MKPGEARRHEPETHAPENMGTTKAQVPGVPGLLALFLACIARRSRYESQQFRMVRVTRGD
jgi:hypothetical protein